MCRRCEWPLWNTFGHGTHVASTITKDATLVHMRAVWGTGNVSLPPVLSISPPVCLVKACVWAKNCGDVGRVVNMHRIRRMASRRHPQERSGQFCSDQHVLRVTRVIRHHDRADKRGIQTWASRSRGNGRRQRFIHVQNTREDPQILHRCRI